MNAPLTEIFIYNPSGVVVMNGSSQTFPVTDNCERNATVMGDDYIKLSFTLPNKIDFAAFSYIEYAGNKNETTQRYFLKEDYFPADKGGFYEYELNFVSFANMLSKSICHRHIEVTDGNDNTEVWDEPEINLNATLEVMAELIIQSIHQAALRLPVCVYTSMLAAMQVGNLQQNTSLLTYSFSGETIFNVLTQIANMNEVEWYIDHENTIPQLHIIKCERYDTIPLNDRFFRTGTSLLPTRSGGLLSCEYSQKWTDIPQFLIPYGSERNMTRKTSVAEIAGAQMYVSYGKRLRLNRYDSLGNLVDYIIKDENGNSKTIHVGEHGEIENTGVTTGIEVVEMFDDVYPRCHYQVVAVEVEGTPEYPKYVITAQAIDEATGNLMSGAEMVSAGIMPITLQEGQTLTIIFESGFLNGREFEVNNRSFKVSGQSAWNLILSIIAEGGEEDDSPMIPFGSFIPRVGDRFAMFGMEMPQGYINNAKQELAQKAYDKMLEIESTRPEVKCTADPNEFKNIYLVLGQRVAVQSDIFGVSTYVSRVTSFSHSLTTPDNVTFKLASSRVVGKLAAVQQAIADQTNDIQGLEQRTTNISRRSWRDTSEMVTMLEALVSEMMLVGVQKYQFAFTSGITCVDVVSGEYEAVFDHLHITAGTIEHTQKPYIDYSNKGVWNVAQQDINTNVLGSALDPLVAYYVYAVCDVPNASTNPNNEAEIILSSSQLSDTKYLLMGILSSEFDDTYDPAHKTRKRVFNRSNGFTAIAGGTITTEQIQDPTRSLIIDFASDPPRIVAKNGAKIIGNIEFTLTEENIQQVLGRLGDIGGENLIETMGEVYIQTGTYVGLNQAVIPFRNRINGSYPTFEAGKYVFSAESINILKTSNGVPPSGIAIEIVNGESRSAITAYWAVQQSNPTTAVELETARPLFLRITWSENAEATITIKNAMLQKGDMATAYIPYIDHLTNALKGSTEVAGGLLMTNVLMLKDENGNVVAGMSGLTDNSEISGSESEGVAMFSGGTYHEALLQAQAAARGTLEQLAKLLPILFTKTGSGSRVGCFNVEDENTVFVENEEKTEKITFDTQLGITISKKINGVYVDKVRMHAGEIQNNTIITAQIGSGTIQYQAVAFNSLPALAFPPNYNSSFVLSSSFSTYRMTGSITSINVYIYTPTYQTSDYQQPFSFQIRNVTFGLLHIASGRKFVLARHDGLNNPYATFTSYYLALQPTSSTFSMVLPSGEYKMYVDIGSATGYTKQNYEGNSYNLKSVLSYPLIGYCPFDGTLYFSSQNNETITEIASNGICVRSPYGAMQFLNSSANGLFAVLSGLPNENGATQVGQLYRDSSGVIKVKMQV